MSCQISLTCALAAAFMLSSGRLVPAAAQSADQFDHRAQCRKGGVEWTRGCTADSSNCKTARDGEMIINVGPPTATGNGRNDRRRCSVTLQEPRTAAATINVGGRTVSTDIKGHSRICLNAHGESGSGPEGHNQVYWTNCSVEYQTLPYR